jgi:hypothetical protein
VSGPTRSGLPRWSAGLLAALVAGVLVAGCGSDGDDDDASTTTTADDASGPEMPDAELPEDGEITSPPAGSDAGGPLGAQPCDVVDITTVETAVDNALRAGEIVDATVTENDLTWTPDECQWENEVLEIEVQVAGDDDFPDGGLLCPEPLGVGAQVTPVDGLGDSAFWVYDDNDGEGTLRVCTATALVDATIAPDDIAPLDAATTQAAATALAEQVLAAL